MMRLSLILLCLAGSLQKVSGEEQPLAKEEELHIDLREPTYRAGTLSTEQGGVIQGEEIRIQARRIAYCRGQKSGEKISKIEAEGDLMLELDEHLLVGERLEYDFSTHTGLLYNGRIGIEPWFIGGEEIYLAADGSYCVKNAYMTTSEGGVPDWQVTAASAHLSPERLLKAEKIKLCVFNIPTLWLSKIEINLDEIFNQPIHYSVGWGGVQGPRIGASYKIFSGERWNIFLRGDYRLRRGLGGGLETNYQSHDAQQVFQTINYVARDISLFNRHERFRYRFEGIYHAVLDEKATIDLTYDKLSDEDMAADYADQSLELVASGKTRLAIRRQEESWIANFVTRIRFNSFETVKQELPNLQLSWKPVAIQNSGIINETQFEAGYLDFAYANNLPSMHNYSSSRVALTTQFYRPTPLGLVTATPVLGTTAIFYGNSPSSKERLLAVGMGGMRFQTTAQRTYSWGKHQIIPYMDYRYYTLPTTYPRDHYIFDIQDGWYRLSQLRIGMDHSFYTKDDGCNIPFRALFLSVYTDAFIHLNHIPSVVPRIYTDCVWNSSSTLRHTAETAWNFQEGELDHINLRTQWTATPNFAVSIEYRHRSAFDWRKADHDNYILDVFRSTEELLHSAVSDRRDTALLHFFYRLHPNWAVEFESLHGWNRRDRTRYTEFEIDLLGTLRSACSVKCVYQHRVGDDRVAVAFSIGAQRPDHARPTDFVPLLSL